MPEIKKSEKKSAAYYIIAFLLITVLVEILAIVWDIISFATSGEFQQLLKLMG